MSKGGLLDGPRERTDQDDENQGKQEQPFQNNVDAPKPYTVFTHTERWLITIIMGIAMFFSPMTANVYFPAMPALAEAAHVSVQDINLTITAYIALQGIAPLFVGDLADKIGRRPVYLLTFVIYITASLGLALTKGSYAVLLSLRTLRSAGCSATAAISYGVLADVAIPSKRGHMLGAAMIAANTGPTVPAFFLALAVLFPETSRRIVDNGSLAAPRWNRPTISFLMTYPRNATSSEEGLQLARKNTRMRFPNPLPALRIIFYRDAALVLCISAVHYVSYYCLQATIPARFADGYNLNGLRIGLTYLAIGIGVAFGDFSNGKFLDINYR
ncbi:uncharacterized protein Z518_03394 [Rhinocladiella mackenziei CBS 650.93]|uniref:Major facilitator superfamily (MFS) profile domain-containing protein n=1 Tax=Rhinocladiella mackenziei CBS 650.93 TaxID=1442369 RepID=A0A0D2G2H0_9EURO|nr:uncharacterized protein Z518_03394 [Rhinocladiella mackenziei CBS 650.93]KIX08737.1 hypothetical protein Z518_03394 [Rhinocladiella mackenziei CBS 650.93]